MEIFLYIVHIVAALSLIVVILLQSGKGGGLGSSFGGASASATKIFGGGGTANVLGRTTVALATLFMATSLTLAWMSSHEDSVMGSLRTKGTPAAIEAQEDQVIEEGSGEGVINKDPSPSLEPTGSPSLLDQEQPSEPVLEKVENEHEEEGTAEESN